MQKYEELAEKYLKDKSRDYFNDVLRFAASLNSKTPMTAKTYITPSKSFLLKTG